MRGLDGPAPDSPAPPNGELRRVDADESGRGTYPWAELAIGESFTVSGETRRAENVRSAAFQYGKRTRTKFSVRTTESDIKVTRTA
jgi:hypothetical protein